MLIEIERGLAGGDSSSRVRAKHRSERHNVLEYCQVVLLFSSTV